MDVGLLRELDARGLPRREIARRLGVPYRTVRHLVRKLGLPPRYGRIDPVRLRALWSAGWTKARIAAALGATLAGVKYRVARLKLPPRGKGWHPPGYAEKMSRILRARFKERPRERTRV